MAKHRSRIERPIPENNKGKKKHFNHSLSFVFSGDLKDWMTSDTATGNTKKRKNAEREKLKAIDYVNHNPIVVKRHWENHKA